MSATIVVGNWKMNGGRAEIASFAAEWSTVSSPVGVEVVIAPPTPFLGMLAGQIPSVAVAGQDCSVYPSGAFTGDVAASMLLDVGARWVILGHSERRQHHGESDSLVAQKLRMALDAGLRPIVCVGETLQQRELGEHKSVVSEQLAGSLEGSPLDDLVIAYEPVWAIGTGVTATPEQANDMHGTIRAFLTERFGANAAATPVLYGGSVKPSNAAKLFACEHIDGALVGGASLKAADFAAIVGAA